MSGTKLPKLMSSTAGGRFFNAEEGKSMSNSNKLNVDPVQISHVFHPKFEVSQISVKRSKSPPPGSS